MTNDRERYRSALERIIEECEYKNNEDYIKHIAKQALNDKHKHSFVAVDTNEAVCLACGKRQALEAGECPECKGIGSKWLDGKTKEAWKSPSNTTCFILKGKNSEEL